MHWRHIGASVLVCLSVSAGTADEGAGLQSPLLVGSDARALAMGRAASAISRGAETVFWNPARLSAMDRGDFSLFRSELYADGVGYHAAYLAYPTLDMGSIGIGYQTISVDDLDRRDDRNAFLGNFNTRESHLLLGYGRELQRRLAVGATFRVVQQSVGDLSATAVGLDLGASWWRSIDASGKHRFLTGITLVHLLQPRLKLDEDESRDPRLVRFGVGYEGSSEGPLQWTTAVDFEVPSAGDGRFGAGVEFGYDGLLFLRGGVEQESPSFGFGVDFHGIRIDYALRTHGELSRNDRLTLGVRFGSSVPERRLARRVAAEQHVESLLAGRLEDREEQARVRSMDEAATARLHDELETARRLYRRVLALEPDHAAALRGLDEVELQIALRGARDDASVGAFARASAAYQSILERWPDSAEAAAGLEEARQALAVASDRQEQLFELFGEALSHFSEGDVLGARRALVELLHLDPEHELGQQLYSRVELLRLERGQARLADAKRQHSAEDFANALKSLGEATRLLVERTDLAALDGSWRKDWAAADAAAERARLAAESPAASAAIESVPLSVEDRARLSELFSDGLDRFTAGDFEGATRRWHAIWTERPDFESVGEYLVKSYLFEGLHLYSQGAYDAAIGRCRRVLEIDPQHSKAQRYLARIEEEQAEILGAEEARR